MPDPRIEKWADALVRFCLDVRPGNLVLIRSTPEAAPLVREVYRRALLAGGHVTTVIGLPGLEEIFYSVATDDQLNHVPPVEELYVARYDCLLTISAASNTQALSGIDPAKIRLAGQARGALLQTRMARSAAGEMRWCSTLYPTEAHAQAAAMSLAEYEAFVYEACRLNESDPVAAWLEQRDTQQRLIDWLTPRDRVHIVGPDIDITMSVRGRTWANSYGVRNFPSGEIFTGPIEDSAEGTIRFTYPASVNGREVEDIRLWFEAGKVVQATAARNEDYLRAMLDSDAGARTLGELGIGANFGIQRFTGSILFDEKIGGTVHLAVGRSYPETGGVNQSAIHWDMVADLRRGGEIRVDGEPFMVDGRFRV